MSKRPKEDWGPGPWGNEPDEKDWVDEATGLNCRIVRGPWGSFCGYVGVPKEHPAYGMTYSPIPIEDWNINDNITWWRRHVTKRVEYKIADIKVHGGLTYSGTLSGDTAILHWFGFDCSHSWDYSPGLSKDIYRYMENDKVVYRNIEYVTKEVESLAKQLAAIKRETDEQAGTSQEA